MYEVEIKAHLRNRVEVVAKLESLGCVFSAELHQTDYIFVPEHVDFPPPLGVPVLRVRKQNDQYFFTLKIPQSNRQDCIEREVMIDDGEKMQDIIRLLGYKAVPTVNKRRIKTIHGDIEIVLDQVEHLGEFIEAEKIVTESNESARNTTQQELLDFLESIGVPKSDQVVDGKYDIMLYEKFSHTQP